MACKREATLAASRGAGPSRFVHHDPDSGGTTLNTQRRPLQQRYRRFIPLLAVASLALGLAACGSSASKSSSGTSVSNSSGSTATSAAPTGTPIKVGSIVEVQGVGLNWEFQEAVVKAAVRGINSRGGVGGHPLELHVCDGQNDPNKQLQCARDLVSQGVVAVVGGVTHLNGAAVDDIFLRNHIAMIGVQPIVTADFISSNEFLIDSGEFGIFAGDVLNAKQHGLKKLWIANLDIPGADLANQVARAAAKAVGIQVVGQSRIPVTSANDAPYVQAALSAGADGILPAMGAAQTSTLILALNQVGAHMTVLNIDTEPADGLTHACGAGGGVCKGALGAGGFLPPTATDNNGIKLFQQDMQAEAASGDAAAKPGSAYDMLALPGWLGMQALAKVTEKLSTITPQSVLDAFTNATGIDLYGIIPNWTPGKSAGITGFPRISNTAVYYTVLQGDLLPHPVDGKAYEFLQLVPALKNLNG